MNRIVLIAIMFLLAFSVRAEARGYTRNVAVVIYRDAEPLDWTGPYEVYNDAASFGHLGGKNAFNVYIVSKTTQPLNAQGLVIVPTYSIENAPRPDIVIVPGGPSDNLINDAAFYAWTKTAMENAEITQTVCTGAFVAAKAGLLDGLEVTTFHGAIDGLAKKYPKTTVRNGRRFVDNGRIVTTAGISAGIDGSLHVIARLLGRRTADQVASYMEYHWVPEPYLSSAYAYLNPSTDARGRLEQTADMAVDEKNYGGAVEAYQTLLERDTENVDVLAALGQALRGAGDHRAAAEAFRKAATGNEGRSEMDTHRRATAFYNAAVEYAAADSLDNAVAVVQQAFAAGAGDRVRLVSDPALARIKDDPRLKGVTASTTN